MSASSFTSSSAVPNMFLDALHKAYTAAMQAPGVLQAEGPALAPSQQREAVQKWAAEYLTSAGAPQELMQDCSQWILSTTASDSEAARGGGTMATAPSEATSRSSAPAASPSEGTNVDFNDDCGSGAGGSPTNRNGAGGAQVPVSLDPSLDVDHCTIARMMRDEAQLWEDLHRTPCPTSDAPATEVEDVFAEEAHDRETWQCWAAVLREVKVEAAVQQHGRRSRETDGRHATLDGLLDHLEAPETPWLLDDKPSSVLVAADLFMKNRPYTTGGAEADESVDEEDEWNGSGKVGRDTHDMRAVHEYLLQQDENEPPLRSLVALTLKSHLGESS